MPMILEELAIRNGPFVWLTASEPIILEIRQSVKAANQWRRTLGRADMLLACPSLAEHGPRLFGPWGRVFYIYELTIKCIHAHPSSEWCSSFSQLLQCPWSSSTSVSFSSCGAVSFSSAIFNQEMRISPCALTPRKTIGGLPQSPMVSVVLSFYVWQSSIYRSIYLSIIHTIISYN